MFIFIYMLYRRRNILVFAPLFWFSQMCLAQYSTTDYLIVNKKLDSINTDFNTHGYHPTATVLTNRKKSLVFFGASHVRQENHPQFKALEEIFWQQKPQVAFHEGDPVPQSRHYSSDTSAIRKGGEKGLIKYLCDHDSTLLLVGDMNPQQEFTELLKRFPADQVYLYMAVERFLNPYKQGHYKGTFEVAFQKEFVSYLAENGFPLSSQARTTAHLKKVYKHYFNKSLRLEDLIQVHEYYLTNTGLFGQIGRGSKDIRDQALLTKIDEALDKYDRVFVVFGGSHWVAVQPALKYLIDKPRL